jgi:hypothetical protein
LLCCLLGQASPSTCAALRPCYLWPHRAGEEEVTHDEATIDEAEPLPDNDLLPFATWDDTLPGRKYPRAGFEFGISAYLPNFTSLSSAITEIENYYRMQGHAISKHDPNMSTGPVVNYNLRVLWSEKFCSSVETYSSCGGDVRMHGVSISTRYRPFHSRKRHAGPFVGLGLGRYSFFVEPEYHDNINGYRLKSIVAQGYALGSIGLVGFELRSSQGSGLDLHAGYIYTPSIATTTSLGTPAEVNLSGAVLGARLMLSF